MTIEPKSTTPFIIRYKNETYDITRFIKNHPGGLNTMKGLQNTNIDKRFALAPPHSDSAMYLLKEYKITDGDKLVGNGHNGNDMAHKEIDSDGEDENGIPVFDMKSNGLNGFANGGKNGHVPNGKANGVHHHENSETNFNKQVVDESMEHLVDWSKAMLFQIPSLGDKYHIWVNKPVDRYLRIFGPWWLEMLTRTPWYAVPIFWIPVILYMSYLGNIQADENQCSVLTKVILFIVGIILWTFLEYILHRYVFHWEPATPNAYKSIFHFVIHGLHHKCPFDPDRLVFPPIPGAMIASILYVPLWLISNNSLLLMAGGITGYVMYDLTHYYLHYGSPSGGHFYKMKRYHYQHHFVHHDLGFGISSDVWDSVFDTKIFLRKLKYILKW